MAARDRYTTPIECPKCKEKGVLHLSENDYPFMRKLNRKLDRIDGRFSATTQGDLAITVSCKACGHEFNT